MGFGEEFRKAYGQGERYRAFTKADRARLEAAVPAYLLDLWESDGWAGYRGGLLWMVDPQEYEPVLRAWNIPESFPLITIARTALGALFLLATAPTPNGSIGQAILLLDPHLGEYMTVGPFAEKYMTRTLAKDGTIANSMQEPETKQAVQDVGPLAWNEMYGYEPALRLGGSGKPDTVRKYNIFNHHLLLSQLAPIKVRKL
jgi:hypothetical protein